eukprot:1139225-Pelagomonas_calceolata.AAC.8
MNIKKSGEATGMVSAWSRHTKKPCQQRSHISCERLTFARVEILGKMGVRMCKKTMQGTSVSGRQECQPITWQPILSCWT